MPRVDIRHLSAKQRLGEVVKRAGAYVDTMAAQGRVPSRIVLAKADYDALHRRAQPAHQNRTIFLCLGDVLVYWNDEPVDETEIAPVSRYPMPPRYDLPPVAIDNPFGISKPVAREPAVTDDSFDDDLSDDDIPF